MITSGGLFCSKSRYSLYAEAVPAAGIGHDFHAMIYIGRRKLLSPAISVVIASSCDSVIASVSFRFIVDKCCSSNSFGSLAFSHLLRQRTVMPSDVFKCIYKRQKQSGLFMIG